MPLSDEEIMQAIQARVLEILRSNGIPAYTPEDIMPEELEAVIKGEG